jgi:transcriptional regulator with XRE-family HTH domain
MTTPGRTPNTVLRTWRETHGLTRAQMAHALNNTRPAPHHYAIMYASPALIAAWEQGRTGWPRPGHRATLHALTGHDPTSLGFTPPPSPPKHIRAKAPDLTTLAAELTQRGYITQLATSPPHLTVRPAVQPLGALPPDPRPSLGDRGEQAAGLSPRPVTTGAYHTGRGRFAAVKGAQARPCGQTFDRTPPGAVRASLPDRGDNPPGAAHGTAAPGPGHPPGPGTAAHQASPARAKALTMCATRP